jgi:hypothetical protein
MPNARFSKRSSARSARRPARRSYRKKGPAVTVTKRVPIARKRTVMRNTRAIARLRTQMAGSVQANLVSWTENDQRVNNEHPILFELDNFTIQRTTPFISDGAAVWQQGSTTPGIDEVSHYKLADNTTSNPFAFRWSEDDVGGGRYTMLMSKTVLRFEGAEPLNNVRIRIQVFSQKSQKHIPALTPLTTSMPDALVHLKNMCDFTAKPNLLPTKYFKVYHDKTIFINSDKSGDTKGTTKNVFYHTITIKPKGGKRVTQGITYPPIQDVRPDPATAPAGGWYGPLNRPSNQPLFCLISSDYVFDVTDVPIQGPVKVSCSQYRKWRDISGAY